MTTQYINRLTLAVPESLMGAANNLALIMGRSTADINTFTNASWEDASGNLYAVCSAVSKPVVVQALSTGFPDPLPSHAENADVILAQQALDAIEVYGEGVAAGVDKIVLAIDDSPLDALSGMGLTRLEEDLT
jgi:hypothetical protein